MRLRTVPPTRATADDRAARPAPSRNRTRTVWTAGGRLRTAAGPVPDAANAGVEPARSTPPTATGSRRRRTDPGGPRHVFVRRTGRGVDCRAMFGGSVASERGSRGGKYRVRAGAGLGPGVAAAAVRLGEVSHLHHVASATVGNTSADRRASHRASHRRRHRGRPSTPGDADHPAAPGHRGRGHADPGPHQPGRDRAPGAEPDAGREPIHRVPDPGHARERRHPGARPPGAGRGVPSRRGGGPRSPGVCPLRLRGGPVGPGGQVAGQAHWTPPRLPPRPHALRDLGLLQELSGVPGLLGIARAGSPPGPRRSQPTWKAGPPLISAISSPSASRASRLRATTAVAAYTTRNTAAANSTMVAPLAASTWKETYIPPNPHTAPTIVESTSILPNESVTRRPTMAGITITAAISVTPRTCIVAMTVAARISANRPSTRRTGTP